MNTLDFVIIAVVLISGALGLSWGIIRQVLAIVGVFAGIALAGTYGPRVSEWLGSFISSGQVTNIFGFLLVFIGVSALASFLASVLHQFAGLLFLGWADHLIGGVIGLVQGAMIAAVLITVLAANPTDQISRFLQDSQFVPTVLQVGGFVIGMLPEHVRSSADIILGGL